MATIVEELHTPASLDRVWDAMRAVGELHTRLVPGFVADTRLEGGVRTVTFVGGAVVREPLVTVSDGLHRVVWTSEGGRATHYNAALQAIADGSGTRVVWTVDALPDAIAGHLATMMRAGMAAMQGALDRLGSDAAV